jgi:aromatic ring hydroxylase
MGARTGQQFIDGLRAQPREVYIEGELVRDVTRHRAFENVLRSLAHLYDMQHDPDLRGSAGERCASGPSIPMA